MVGKRSSPPSSQFSASLTNFTKDEHGQKHKERWVCHPLEGEMKLKSPEFQQNVSYTPSLKIE